jgi:Domain of unknown function DUF11
MFRRPRVLRNGLALVSASALATSLTAPVPAVAASQSADIAVTNTASAPVISSGVLVPETFTITVKNWGLGEAQNVAMSDTAIFAGVTATAPAGVSCATPPANSWGTTTCTTRSLGPGAAMTIKLRGKVLAMHNQCVLSNVATATSATFDPNLNNNTAAAIIRSNQLQCL